MKSTTITFEIFFKAISYSVVFCGFLSLWVSGSLGIVIGSGFLFILSVAWFLEIFKWQFSDRIGTFLMFLIVPLFFILWKFRISVFSEDELAIIVFLGRMILALSAIKLLQKKSDKDWIFLYLISFFEVLLAAGLSVSPLYLVSFILFLLTCICAVISFEIRKTSRTVQINLAKEKNINLHNEAQSIFEKYSVLWLPKTAVLLLLLMIAVATPLFFLLPRVASADFGNSSGGLSGFTGFSDSVELGAIGSLKQSDAIVMRVKLEETNEKKNGSLHWRGIALDSFDNKIWSKSKNVFAETLNKGDKDFFLLDYPSNKSGLTVQTFYIEPIDSSVVFALAKPVAVQGGFKTLIKDTEGALNFPRTGFERMTYKVYSNQTLPSKSILQADTENYSLKDSRYLELPDNIDQRIAQLAFELTHTAKNRYDKAKIVESYLQNNFGYTLELKASGEQPLADFLFNIREGHCEYFATAMAVMLRTQGIATRIVNGFQEGDYNETAEVYVVRQKNAHSWVEVYFPGENAWIPFDPTPFAGQNDGTTSLGVAGKFNNYIEALETFWIQYFVSYDNQEQHSLFRSAKNSFTEYQTKISTSMNKFRQVFSDWWKEVRGDNGLAESAKAVGFSLIYVVSVIFGVFVLIWIYRKIIKFEIWGKVFSWSEFKKKTTIVEFYEKMQNVLAAKGLTREAHQTPLEFAFALNMPEAVRITEKYNRVRFGKKNLSEKESREIDDWLKNLQKNETSR